MDQYKDQVIFSSFFLIVGWLNPALSPNKNGQHFLFPGGEDKQPHASAETSARGDGGGADAIQRQPQEAAARPGGRF